MLFFACTPLLFAAIATPSANPQASFAPRGHELVRRILSTSELPTSDTWQGINLERDLKTTLFPEYPTVVAVESPAYQLYMAKRENPTFWFSLSNSVIDSQASRQSPLTNVEGESVVDRIVALLKVPGQYLRSKSVTSKEESRTFEAKFNLSWQGFEFIQPNGISSVSIDRRTGLIQSVTFSEDCRKPDPALAKPRITEDQAKNAARLAYGSYKPFNRGIIKDYGWILITPDIASHSAYNMTNEYRELVANEKTCVAYSVLVLDEDSSMTHRILVDGRTGQAMSILEDPLSRGRFVQKADTQKPEATDWHVAANPKQASKLKKSSKLAPEQGKTIVLYGPNNEAVLFHTNAAGTLLWNSIGVFEADAPLAKLIKATVAKAGVAFKNKN